MLNDFFFSFFCRFSGWWLTVGGWRLAVGGCRLAKRLKELGKNNFKKKQKHVTTIKKPDLNLHSLSQSLSAYVSLKNRILQDSTTPREVRAYINQG